MQRRTVRIQRQLSQPNFTEDPKRKRNYNEAPRISATRRCQKSSSPTTIVEKDLRHDPELEEPHRALALKEVEVDTHPEG